MIFAILNLGKDGLNPEDDRPIALRSVCYKLLEKFVLNSIKLVVEKSLGIE